MGTEMDTYTDAWIDGYPEGGMVVVAPATENSGYFLSKEFLLPFLQPFPLSGELSRPLPLPYTFFRSQFKCHFLRETV